MKVVIKDVQHRQAHGARNQSIQGSAFCIRCISDTPSVFQQSPVQGVKIGQKIGPQVDQDSGGSPQISKGRLHLE